MKCCNTSVYDLRTGRDLYRAVPALTRGLDLHGLSRRTVPLIYLLRQAWVTESLFQINPNPHWIAKGEGGRDKVNVIITIKSENGDCLHTIYGVQNLEIFLN